MFGSLDHSQRATLFLAKVTSETFINFFVFSNFSLVFLKLFLSFACWALNFMNVFEVTLAMNNVAP